MNFAIAILYTPKGRRPRTIATVKDHDLLQVVAARAIQGAKNVVARLNGDPILELFQEQELEKLKRILSPFLNDPQTGIPDVRYKQCRSFVQNISE